MAVIWVRFSVALCSSVFPHVIFKTDAARINTLEIEMFHDESWKPTSFWGQKVKGHVHMIHCIVRRRWAHVRGALQVSVMMMVMMTPPVSVFGHNAILPMHTWATLGFPSMGFCTLISAGFFYFKYAVNR